MKRTLSLIALAAGLLPAAAQPCMTLRECIDYAVAHNVQVRQQENAVRSQHIALNTARRARLPEVAAGAGQSVNFGRGLTADNTYVNRNTQSTDFSLTASVPVFSGGRIGARRTQEELNLKAALADLDRVRDDLGMQVAQGYLEALYRQELAVTAARQLEVSRSQHDRMAGLHAAGKASPLQLAEARNLVAQDELALVQAENARRLAWLDLTQFMEYPSPDSLLLVAPADSVPAAVVASPQAVYEEAVETRPEIRAGILRTQSAESGVRLARSAYWPTLSLSGGLGSSYYHTNGMERYGFGAQMRDNFNKYLGLSLSIPIFDRLQTRNAVRQATVEVATRMLQTEEARKTLYKDIQQAWYNAVGSRQKWEASVEAERAAAEALRLMTRRYETGLAEATEYGEARTKYLNATTERIAALYDCLFRQKILDFYRGRRLE